MRKILFAALLTATTLALAGCGQSMDKVDQELDKRAAADASAAAANVQAGQAFLAQTAKQPGVVSLPNGLLYKVVSSPDPNAPKPAATDVVRINYEGKLVDGQIFDSSYARNEPATYALPKLVEAWQIAVPMMHKGDTWMLYVPPELGYGSHDQGDAIPANSVLVFKIQLLDINPKA